MPNDQNAPVFAGQNYVDMASAPGGDVNFDDLFPIEDGNQPAPQAAGTEQPPASQPQAPVVEEDFLKAGSSIYKTREEAARGIEHKDATIERLRQFAIQQTGYDPLAERQVTQPQATHQQPPTQQQGSQFQYLGNGKRYYEDLSAAVSKGDMDRYEQIQRTYNSEVLQSAIGPAAPLLGEVARQRAVREVAKQIPEFQQFVDSDGYREVLDRMPILKNAIQMAENDFNMAPKLSELYQLTYLAHAGSRRNGTQAPPVTQVPTTPAARPTTTPSTMTPPSSSTTSVNTPDWARNSEVRKQLIKDSETRGVLDIKF